MCFKQDSATSSLNGKPLKLIDHFTYPGSNISSAESDVSIQVKHGLISDLSDEIKWEFFQAVAVSVLLYDYTT